MEKITKKRPIKGIEKPIKEPIKGTEKPIKEPIKGVGKPIKEPIKGVGKPIKELTKSLYDVVVLMRNHPTITYEEMVEILGVKKSAVYERIKKLKGKGIIKREGGRYAGKWIVID